MKNIEYNYLDWYDYFFPQEGPALDILYRGYLSCTIYSYTNSSSISRDLSADNAGMYAQYIAIINNWD